MYQLSSLLQRVRKCPSSPLFSLLFHRQFEKKKSRNKKKSEKEHRNELNNFKCLLNITEIAFDPLGWLSVLTTKTLQRNWHGFAFQGWSRMEGWSVCECVRAASPFYKHWHRTILTIGNSLGSSIMQNNRQVQVRSCCKIDMAMWTV